MIQRIQSVYLLLTTILSGLFLTGNILKLISGVTSELIMNFRGIYEATGENSFELIEKAIPVSLVSVLVPLISLLAIFLYKNRSLQLKVTLTLIILEILLVAVETYYIINFIQCFDALLIPGLRTVIPFLTIVFSFLAYRGIRKDNNLVKSYERLR